MQTARVLLAAVASTAAALGAVDFAARVYPVMEQAQCRSCHQENGIAGATRLQFPPPEANAAEINAFGMRLAPLVDRGQPERSLLLAKPTNRFGHTGGERIKRGSEQEKILEEWVRFLASAPPAPSAPAVTAVAVAKPVKRGRLLRRLTHAQYNHTVRDLLNDQSRPADKFPKEDVIHGFTNQAEGQSISPLQAEAYNRAAEALARNAFRGGDPNRLVPCKPAGPADPACRDHFVRSFGLRAFRRPLASAEAVRYARFFDEEARRSNDFYKGAQFVVEAMLQSPNFLYHVEAGSDRSLEPYQIATRLAYFLWDTMPDPPLLEAARTGKLNSKQGVEAEARRLLADPLSARSLEEFLSQWLRLDRLASAIRDRRLFPEFNGELLTAMARETKTFFTHLVAGNRDFREFYSARYSFLNPDLAKLYGLNAPASEFGRVEYPESSGRSGILGQASFLTLTSKPAETAPTERGLYIREHLLCQIVPPPPPGVNTNLPQVTDEKPMTNRDRLKIHLSNAACAGCHTLIDSVGYGLEQYDAIGRFREKQLVKIYPTLDQLRTKTKTKPTEFELDLDHTATLRGIANSDFSSPRELGRILADDPGCQKCVVKQVFRYAMGRPETGADREAIDTVFAAFRASGFHFRDLILSLVTHPVFVGGSS